MVLYCAACELCDTDTFDRLDLDCAVKGKDTRECNVCAKLLNGNFSLFIFATIHLSLVTLLLCSFATCDLGVCCVFLLLVQVT